MKHFSDWINIGISDISKRCENNFFDLRNYDIDRSDIDLCTIRENKNYTIEYSLFNTSYFTSTLPQAYKYTYTLEPKTILSIGNNDVYNRLGISDLCENMRAITHLEDAKYYYLE